MALITTSFTLCWFILSAGELISLTVYHCVPSSPDIVTLSTKPTNKNYKLFSTGKKCLLSTSIMKRKCAFVLNYCKLPTIWDYLSASVVSETNSPAWKKHTDGGGCDIIVNENSKICFWCSLRQWLNSFIWTRKLGHSHICNCLMYSSHQVKKKMGFNRGMCQILKMKYCNFF